MQPWIDVARAIAWPVAVLVIAFGFRRPLGAFVTALGSRVNKLSLFKVEIELVPAKADTSTPQALDVIRTSATSAPINDSSRTMLTQVQHGTPADYALIDIGCGGEWLTSRLYIAAVMLERMRGLRALVFVQTLGTTRNRLLAVASVSDVRWSLAQRYPELEAAWARAYLELFPSGPPPAAPGAPPAASPVLPAGATWSPDPRTLSVMAPIVMAPTGSLEAYSAQRTVSRFIDSLQRAKTATQPAGWVTLSSSTAKEERAQWVTSDLLRELLPDEAFAAWCDAFEDAPRARRTRATLRRIAPFVALTRGDREFVRLVNRGAFVEQMIAPFAEEPE